MYYIIPDYTTVPNVKGDNMDDIENNEDDLNVSISMDIEISQEEIDNLLEQHWIEYESEYKNIKKGDVVESIETLSSVEYIGMVVDMYPSQKAMVLAGMNKTIPECDKFICKNKFGVMHLDKNTLKKADITLEMMNEWF